MTFKRWIPTFLAFPLGGLIAIETVGVADGPLSAALGGLVVGAAVGGAQWLALRAAGTSRRWIGRTAAATAAGAALAAVITGSGTAVADLMLTGAVIGAVVGAARARCWGAAPASRGLDRRHGPRGASAGWSPRRSSSTPTATTTSSARPARWPRRC